MRRRRGALAAEGTAASSRSSPASTTCRFKRIVEPGDVLDLECEVDARARPGRQGQGARDRRRRARRAAATLTVLRWRGMIGAGRHGAAVSITGPRLPRARPRRHERRARASSSTRPTSGSSSAPASASAGWRRRARRCRIWRCPPRSARSSRRASTADDIDLIIVATVTPGHGLPVDGGARSPTSSAPRDAAAYDLSAGCTGFMYALAQAYGMSPGGSSKRALVDRRRRPLEDPRLERPLDARALRRRRRRRRARAGARAGLPRLRARRGRRGRREPLAARQRLHGVRRSRAIRAR